MGVDVGRVTRDVRALGAGAPVRAAYEASKRFGGHRAVFGGLERRAHRSPGPTDIEAVRPAGASTLPPRAAIRTVEAAEAILGGVVVLFGREVPFVPDGRSQAIIDGDGCWPDVPWWEIDLRSDARPGDVKWAWELGRHRHVVVLARAASLSDDPRFGAALEATLWHWMNQNPPERGVHWYSNLEIALRALAWCEVLALAGALLRDGTREEMLRHLSHSGRHLVADLPYTLSTMRNNHLLGDGLGLMALGRLFPQRDRSWGRIGRWLFASQLERHVHDDGSMIEDSLSYHRFVLEMLVRRVQLGGPVPAARDAMLGAAQYLARLGALEGPLPQYGDWDEGRVLAVAPGDQSVAGAVRLALAVGGEGAPEEWRSEHDECAWYVATGIPAGEDAAVTDGAVVGGGFSRASVAETTVWLKWGGDTSHQHADLSSVSVWHGGEWWVVDPGTGTYNGPLEVRNYFRTSLAHSVLRIEDTDQLEPHRAFRWVNVARGVAGEPLVASDAVVMWGAHDAYRRLDPGRRVARAVVLRAGDVTVIDWVEGSPTRAAVSIPSPRARRGRPGSMRS